MLDKRKITQLWNVGLFEYQYEGETVALLLLLFRVDNNNQFLMQMKFRFAAVRCFFCQGVFFFSLCFSRIFSPSLSLSMCARWQDIYSFFVFSLSLQSMTGEGEKAKKSGWSIVEVATSNFFIGRYNRIFLLLLLLGRRRYHCVIDESNRMCVHKTFPVSPQLSRTIDR